MSEILTRRRGFLRGLLSLPLIGGGVTLIGTPIAAAVPVTSDLLEHYQAFLLAEAISERDLLRHPEHPYLLEQRRQWCREMRWYHGAAARPEIMTHVRAASAGSRAAVVLAAAGLAWQVSLDTASWLPQGVS
ncbi:hypothetical protein [Xanthobacter versatilis]|uniref:hypothetical protein n=1 Tax=Xanthobacter autotrophicus (strain ATCC BAA-1158 / Py2) TaxID=78245 RepID=UPI0037280D56